MNHHHIASDIVRACAVLLLGMVGFAHSQETARFILPEQRCMEIRSTSRLPRVRLPDVPPPRTVANPWEEVTLEHLSLDDAIQITLTNSEVIRVLAGVTAAASGRTIYDPAINNTGIDRARGLFDPKISIQNNFNRREIPQAVFDPAFPQVQIHGDATRDYNMLMGLSKRTTTGGTLGFNVNAVPSRTSANGLPLNPQTRSSVDMSISQPLLQGAGRRANLAPIVVARIDTERSFFQMKSAVQRSVEGVIASYWALVFARTDLWAREQQVAQGEFAYRMAEARSQHGQGNAGDLAHSRSALASFRATLVQSRANVLQREAALWSILGLPPSSTIRLVPTSPPKMEKIPVDWNRIVGLAEEYRPDLIELKLILEADSQRLLMAQNQTLPRVDATALYRWNGLEGRMPNNNYISTGAGDFTGWQLGVNFSVPLGLRRERAELRQSELVMARDRANIQQGLLDATHLLATNCRNLDQYYEQYRAYQETRAASEINLDQQFKRYRAELANFIDLLTAITQWGNAVSSESQAIVQYNTELARLELQTGTILETHGVRFVEERYRSIGPLGRLFPYPCYPRDKRPSSNSPRYEDTNQPAEKAFHLDNPLPPRQQKPKPRLPVPVPLPVIGK